MMVPFVVTMIPTFVIVARLGWQDTYQGLIVPILAQGAFGTFLFRQFFMGIPEEIGDAATVDGANPLDIYWRIYLPLSGLRSPRTALSRRSRPGTCTSGR